MKNRLALPSLLVGCGAISITLACGGILLVPIFVDRMLKSRIGPLHSFPIASRPNFLTEGLALSKAREALSLDGYDPAIWLPYEDRRTKAPDGSTDFYLVRNGITADAGCVMFVNQKSRNSSRIVEVELKKDAVECRVIIPK